MTSKVQNLIDNLPIPQINKSNQRFISFIKVSIVKYEIGFDDALFVLAGLYTHYNDSKTYTVLTTETIGIMREIHNSKLRMPVALRSDAEIKEWLHNGNVKPRQDFTAMRLDPEQLQLF